MTTEEVGHSQRPVPLHREKHPDLDVEGCFGCKAAGIRFGIETLKSQNRAHKTSKELYNEWSADWKADGIDVKKAGSTSPSSGPLL